MKIKITALVISVVIICSALVGCNEKVIDVHNYEAVVDSEPFSLTYLVSEDGETVRSEKEMAEIDKACAKALADALYMFSAENTAGIGEINKEVDAVFDCSKKLVELLDYTYSISTMTGGEYQPVFGSVIDLYKSGEEITEASIAEAMLHTGLDHISVDGTTIRKDDRLAKLDYDSISAGYALADAAAALSVKGVNYAILTYKNTVVTYGENDQGNPDDKVNVAVYTSDNDDQYHGIISFENSVLSTCDKNSLVIDSKTGKRVESQHDTVVVLCGDGILSNALAPVLYGMSTEEIERIYNSKVIKFEAVVIENDGEVYKTSDAVEYHTNEEPAE